MMNNSPSQQQLNLENAQRLQLFGQQHQLAVQLAAAQQQQQQQAAASANPLHALMLGGVDLGSMSQGQLAQLISDPHGRAVLGMSY